MWGVLVMMKLFGVIGDLIVYFLLFLIYNGWLCDLGYDVVYEVMYVLDGEFFIVLKMLEK